MRFTKEGARDVFIADDDRAEWDRLRSEGYAPAAGEQVSYVDKYGHQTVVDPSVVQRDIERGEQGYVEDTATVSERNRSERIKEKSSAVGSAGRGLLGGLSFGLSDRLFDPETIEADIRHHGTARTVGEIGSFFVPGTGGVGLIGKGAKAAKAIKGADAVGDVVRAERTAMGVAREAVERVASHTPLGLANRAGRGVADLIKTEGRIANVTRAGIAGATAGGIQSAGRELVNQATDDHDGIDAEAVIGAGVHGAVVGGGLGAGGAALSEGIGAIGSRLTKATPKGVPQTPQTSLPGFEPPAPQATVPGMLDRRGGRWLDVGPVVRALPGGKFLAATVEKGGPTALVLAAVQEGGLANVASIFGTALPVAAGAAVAGKAIRTMFSDPVRGGLMSAHGSQVLSGLPIFDGDGDRTVSPPTDIRRAASDLASRVRSITPDQAAKLAGDKLGPDADPVRLVKVQETARTRHRVLQEVVDRVVPASTSVAGAVLPPRMPNARDARSLVDPVRILAAPTNFVVMASQGRLSPKALALAEQVWPSTVSAVRQRLMDWLSTSPKMTPAERRAVEAILGGGLLSQTDSRRASYMAAMQGSHARAQAPTPPPPAPPSQGGASADVPLDPATSATTLSD